MHRNIYTEHEWCVFINILKAFYRRKSRHLWPTAVTSNLNKWSIKQKPDIIQAWLKIQMHSNDEALNTCNLNAVVCKGHGYEGGRLKLVTAPCYLCAGLLNYISSAQSCMLSHGLHDYGVHEWGVLLFTLQCSYLHSAFESTECAYIKTFWTSVSGSCHVCVMHWATCLSCMWFYLLATLYICCAAALQYFPE